MVELNNEFNRLLSYLERQLPKVAPTVIQKESKKNKEVSSTTKQLLEDSQVSKYSEVHTFKQYTPKSTDGFDVEIFESLMRSKLVDDHKRLQSYERPYISVSELYSCLRKCYYTRKRYAIDVKEQFSFSYLYMIQKIGNVLHDLIQELYNFEEVEKSILSEKYKTKGRLDALKGRFLHEIKSIDSDKYQHKFIKEHFYQGNIYAHILNTEYNYKIDTITILYVLRNLKKIYPFDIPYDAKLAVSFLENAPILLDALNRNKVPEPIGFSNEQCNYCLYKKYCENDKCEEKQPFIKDTTTKEKVDERKKPVFLM